MAFADITRIRNILLLFAGILVFSCSEEPQLWKVDSEEQVIYDYVASLPDQYSEFQKLIEYTEMGSLLKVRGPFTLFLPTDEAMFEYYLDKDMNSLEDFSASQLSDLIRNHIVAMEISTDEIRLGTLREPNALGDFLVTEFRGSDIIMSKESIIVKRNIRTSNGYIHVIDKVLDPVTKDLFKIINSDPSYSIFTKGLMMTGLMDTLQIISFPYGENIARTRFTLLGVADSIYQRYGINNIHELIEWTGANPDSIRFPDNPLKEYMEYHCLNGTYYLSDLETGSYPNLSRDNFLFVTIDNEDYKLNINDSTNSYTGFNIAASNIPAKNGALHAINDILPVIDPEPASMLFETTDFFDLKLGDYYLSHFQRFFDGEETFVKIKWEGDYLLYYFNAGTKYWLKNEDCLSTIGWWNISVTFPKIMKGKYELYIYQPTWLYVSTCAVYVDGDYAGTYKGSGAINNGSDAGLQKVAELDFQNTAEHTIKLRSMSSGQLFWDYVLFEPIIQPQ